MLARLDVAQRRSNHATALAHSFALEEMVHLHQAELKARRKKGNESMADLGRDVAKLVRLANPIAEKLNHKIFAISTPGHHRRVLEASYFQLLF